MEKRLLEWLKQRWMDKVEKNIAEIGIHEEEIVAQDRDQ